MMEINFGKKKEEALFRMPSLPITWPTNPMAAESEAAVMANEINKKKEGLPVLIGVKDFRDVEDHVRFVNAVGLNRIVVHHIGEGLVDNVVTVDGRQSKYIILIRDIRDRKSFKLLKYLTYLWTTMKDGGTDRNDTGRGGERLVEREETIERVEKFDRDRGRGRDR